MLLTPCFLEVRLYFEVRDFLTKFKNLKSLGLKTVKERVRYLNGILKVESSPDSGSVFKVIIQTT